jgi:ribonucleoside-diphosphate reductase beta chain
MYRNAIRNTWTVEEVDFSGDVNDLKHKFGPAERHLIERLVAFFATGDSIVANNLVLNLYQHTNAPEARMYLSRQLYEEALHVQFYLTLLDTYLPDPRERARAFAAVENIPSIQRKAAFCFKWMDSLQDTARLETQAQRRQFLLNLICFAACIEGLFFFGAFAYVYYLRSRGCCTAWRRAPTGCSATRARTWRSRSKSSARRARKNPICSTPTCKRRSCR